MPYATLEQLKAYVNIEADNNDDDVLLADLLERAQAMINAHCNRVFEAVSESRCYTMRDVQGDVLFLDKDLVSVETLVNGGAGGAEIATSDYVLLPRNERPGFAIQLINGASWDADDEHPITVEGAWGYSATPPEDVVHATIRLAAYLYRARDAQVFETTSTIAMGTMTIPHGLPVDVRLILDRYKAQVGWR